MSLERWIVLQIDLVIAALGAVKRWLGDIEISAIDDFGAGYSGLNLLADFQPESIKIDMSLIRGINVHGPRQAIVRGIIRTCSDLGIDIVAEGIESEHEWRWCAAEGIQFFQGYFFAKPGFEFLPLAFYPAA